MKHKSIISSYILILRNLPSLFFYRSAVSEFFWTQLHHSTYSETSKWTKLRQHYHKLDFERGNFVYKFPDVITLSARTYIQRDCLHWNCCNLLLLYPHYNNSTLLPSIIIDIVTLSYSNFVGLDFNLAINYLFVY